MPYFVAAEPSGRITAVHFANRETPPKNRPIAVPPEMEIYFRAYPIKAWYDHRARQVKPREKVAILFDRRQFLADGTDRASVRVLGPQRDWKLVVHQNRTEWSVTVPTGESLELATQVAGAIAVKLDEVEYMAPIVSLYAEEVMP